MMDTPERLLGIVKVANKKHGTAEQATKFALREWRKCDERESFLGLLEERAIRELVHRERHHDTNAIRKAAGDFGGPAKLDPAVRERVMNSVLETYCIDGRRLGSILGKEFPSIIAKEQNKALGSLFNVRLLTMLQPRVSADKRVDQCVKDNEAFTIIEELRQGNEVLSGPSKRTSKRQAAVELAAAGH